MKEYEGGYLGDMPRAWASVLNEKTYGLIKRIYDTAANDRKINREVGAELAKIGGMAAMQVNSKKM